jgi:hypothetical protein
MYKLTVFYAIVFASLYSAQSGSININVCDDFSNAPKDQQINNLSYEAIKRSSALPYFGFIFEF